MSNFFKKMYICLFEPRKIGFFLGEKLHKSFIHILLLALIVVSPLVIELSLKEEISNNSHNIIENYLIRDAKGNDLILKDNILTGKENSEGFAFLIDEAILCFNPKNEKREIGIEYATYHIIEFNKEKLDVIYLNNVVYSKTYEELGVTEIDFSKISDADYLELDKLIELINLGFKNFKVVWVITNSVISLIDIYITLILSALLMAFIFKIFSPMIPFRLRFKGALDSQIISMLCMLLMLLFKLEFIRYIGIIVSGIYFFIAITTIVKIEIIRRNIENHNSHTDKEE